MSRLISRDPFSRTEIHSEIVYDVSCKWCGSHRTTRGGKKYGFKYRQEHDAGRKSYIPGHYCSINCMRDSIS